MKTNIMTIAFGFLGMFLFASLAQAAVVTQYSFENNLTDTAPSGVSFDNLSATSLVGPLNTVYVPGVVGRAVQIGGAFGDATVLEAADSNDLDLGGAEWTIEAFVYRTSDLNSQWERFAVKWFGPGGVAGPGTDFQWHWAFRDSTRTGGPKSQDLFADGFANRINDTSTPEVPVGEWVHVAITNDAANGLRAWQNGVVIDSQAFLTIADGSHPLRFGNNVVGETRFQFRGWVDEFLIHDVSQDAAYMEARTALSTIPEPTTLVIWSLLATLGLSFYRRRRRRAA